MLKLFFSRFIKNDVYQISPSSFYAWIWCLDIKWQLGNISSLKKKEFWWTSYLKAREIDFWKWGDGFHSTQKSLDVKLSFIFSFVFTIKMKICKYLTWSVTWHLLSFPKKYPNTVFLNTLYVTSSHQTIFGVNEKQQIPISLHFDFPIFLMLRSGDYRKSRWRHTLQHVYYKYF